MSFVGSFTFLESRGALMALQSSIHSVARLADDATRLNVVTARSGIRSMRAEIDDLAKQLDLDAYRARHPEASPTSLNPDSRVGGAMTTDKAGNIEVEYSSVGSAVRVPWQAVTMPPSVESAVRGAHLQLEVTSANLAGVRSAREAAAILQVANARMLDEVASHLAGLRRTADHMIDVDWGLELHMGTTRARQLVDAIESATSLRSRADVERVVGATFVDGFDAVGADGWRQLARIADVPPQHLPPAFRHAPDSASALQRFARRMAEELETGGGGRFIRQEIERTAPSTRVGRVDVPVTAYLHELAIRQRFVNREGVERHLHHVARSIADGHGTAQSYRDLSGIVMLGDDLRPSGVDAAARAAIKGWGKESSVKVGALSATFVPDEFARWDSVPQRFVEAYLR